jgi:hypothetical protein
MVVSLLSTLDVVSLEELKNNDLIYESISPIVKKKKMFYAFK